MRCPRLYELPHPPIGKTGWPWTEETPPFANSKPDHSPQPMVSIVTPSFKQGEFIEETIRSVLLQGYPNLEYIIIDGGSFDNSVAIIKKYEKWLKYWVSEPDSGQSHAINKGFAMASGEVFGWVNSDDILLPMAIERLITLRQKNPSSIAWVGGCMNINRDGGHLKTILPRLGTKQQIAEWSYSTWFAQPSCLFEGKTFKEIDGLKEHLRYVLDVDLWIRMINKGPFASTPHIVSAPRMYAGIKTFEDISMRRAEHIRICFENSMPNMARALMQRYEKVALENLSYTNLFHIFIIRSFIKAVNLTKKIIILFYRFLKKYHNY